MHSPAEVVRAILDNAGVIQMPGVTQLPGDEKLPVCFVGSMPQNYDRCITIYDIAGLNQGRTMDGRNLNHPGIKTLIRTPPATDGGYGYTLAQLISDTLDAFYASAVVVTPNWTYYVQSVYQGGVVISLGEDTSKRQVWVLNSRIAFQDTAPLYTPN